MMASTVFAGTAIETPRSAWLLRNQALRFCTSILGPAPFPLLTAVVLRSAAG